MKVQPTQASIAQLYERTEWFKPQRRFLAQIAKDVKNRGPDEPDKGKFIDVYA